MTAIAAVCHESGVWMGADSAITDSQDTSLIVTASPKVFRVGPVLIGWAGMARAGRVLQYSFTPPKHPRRMKPDRYIATLFVDAVRKAMVDANTTDKKDNREASTVDVLVAYQGRVWLIDGNFASIESARSYCATGCATGIVLGALGASEKLPPRQRILKALRLAEEHNSGVRGPFTVIESEGRKP